MTLTKAELDGNDVRHLANTTDMVRWTITVPGIVLGEHTFTFNGEDAVGNSLDVDAVIIFTVGPPLAFDLNLISVPRDPKNTDINAVFGPVDAVDLVLTYDLQRAEDVGRADVDQSGCVDQGDLSVIAGMLGSSATATVEGVDINGDGSVDVRDLGRVGLLFGQGTDTGSMPTIPQIPIPFCAPRRASSRAASGPSTPSTSTGSELRRP